MRRYYAAHRRAYVPRVWPMAVPTAVLVAVLAGVLRAGVLATLVVSITIGVAVMHARWAIWRRRHPVIARGQYVRDQIDDMRRKAHLN